MKYYLSIDVRHGRQRRFHNPPLVIAPRCAPVPAFLPTREDWKANRADFPAARKLRIEVFGKPRKSTSKTDARARDRRVRGTMEYPWDNDYSAPDAQQKL